MASNFKISISQKDNNLHLDLLGDFDGSSASELIHVTRANSVGVSQVNIHTDNLSGRIHPFGQDIFNK